MDNPQELKLALSEFLGTVSGLEEAIKAAVGRATQSSAGGDPVSSLAARISGTQPNNAIANLVGNTVGNGISGAASTVSQLGAMAGPIGKLVSGFTELWKATDNLARAQVDLMQGYAKYNGTIAQAGAQLLIGRTVRAIEFGSATSETAKGLFDSQNRLEEARQPYEISWTNFANETAQSFNELKIGILKNLSFIATVAKNIDDGKHPGQQAREEAIHDKNTHPVNYLIHEISRGYIGGRKIPPLPAIRGRRHSQLEHARDDD
ncbi:MAG TPA: hypothetical protein VFE24_03750 [Pirellulales bacterium]|jgi:hypothetical protein|nr:hypothetical protein [Pirellulales bacterium]